MPSWLLFAAAHVSLSTSSDQCNRIGGLESLRSLFTGFSSKNHAKYNLTKLWGFYSMCSNSRVMSCVNVSDLKKLQQSNGINLLHIFSNSIFGTPSTVIKYFHLAPIPSLEEIWAWNGLYLIHFLDSGTQGDDVASITIGSRHSPGHWEADTHLWAESTQTSHNYTGAVLRNWLNPSSGHKPSCGFILDVSTLVNLESSSDF